MALLRPVDNLLVMFVLAFANQVKKLSDFQDEAPSGVKIAKRETDLAETLIDMVTAENFDLAAYKDEYETELTTLIEAKAKGRTITKPLKGGSSGPVINLMDALRASLDAQQKGKKRAAIPIALRSPKKRAISAIGRFARNSIGHRDGALTARHRLKGFGEASAQYRLSVAIRDAHFKTNPTERAKLTLMVVLARAGEVKRAVDLIEDALPLPFDAACTYALCAWAVMRSTVFQT